jgi:hypothetical protein
MSRSGWVCVTVRCAEHRGRCGLRVGTILDVDGDLWLQLAEDYGDKVEPDVEGERRRLMADVDRWPLDQLMGPEFERLENQAVGDVADLVRYEGQLLLTQGIQGEVRTRCRRHGLVTLDLVELRAAAIDAVATRRAATVPVRRK